MISWSDLKETQEEDEALSIRPPVNNGARRQQKKLIEALCQLEQRFCTHFGGHLGFDSHETDCLFHVLMPFIENGRFETS